MSLNDMKKYCFQLNTLVTFNVVELDASLTKEFQPFFSLTNLTYTLSFLVPSEYHQY